MKIKKPQKSGRARGKRPAGPVSGAEMLNCIRELVGAFRELEHVYDKLDSLIGVNCDSALFRTAYDMFGKYLESVAIVVGDDCGRLSWYIWDNECGKRGLTASVGNREIAVRTPEQLLSVIRGCR